MMRVTRLTALTAGTMLGSLAGVVFHFNTASAAVATRPRARQRHAAVCRDLRYGVRDHQLDDPWSATGICRRRDFRHAPG